MKITLLSFVFRFYVMGSMALSAVYSSGDDMDDEDDAVELINPLANAVQKLKLTIVIPTDEENEKGRAFLPPPVPTHKDRNPPQEGPEIEEKKVLQDQKKEGGKSKAKQVKRKRQKMNDGTKMDVD